MSVCTKGTTRKLKKMSKKLNKNFEKDKLTTPKL